MGAGLFCVDMTMLVFYYMTINAIVSYYTKEYKVNKAYVWFCVHIIALTYSIEMVWSDLFNWGSWFNKIAKSYYTKDTSKGNLNNDFDFYLISICMLNAIVSTWIQGHIVLSIFNYFGKLKFDSRKRSLKIRKEQMIAGSVSHKKSLNDPSNPSSLMSLLNESEKEKEV